ncbi:MAG: peptide deformylase [Myxococcales bacterium]|nr:peptide deformylase [Myxococcales bacterium]
MSILKVARMGHPILRTVADAIPDEMLRSPEIQQLIDDMVDTMVEYDGVGLAAPQVHQSWRLFVMEVPSDSPRYGETGAVQPLTIVVNPEYSPIGDDHVESMEGCLSIPDVMGLVPRHERIKVRFQGRDGKLVEGELSGFPAIVFQHEYDHLDGVLYIDRMESLETLSFRREYERFGRLDGE